MKKLCMGVAVAALVLGGCVGTKPGAQVSPADELRARIYELTQNGRTNEVVRVLEKALDNDDLKPMRVMLFRDLISLVLSTGDVQKAQKRYLKAISAEDKSLVRGALGLIENHLQERARWDDLATWCETLLTKDIEEQVKIDVMGFRFDGCRSEGKMDNVIGLIPGLPAKFSPAAVGTILDRLLERVLAARQYPDLERVMALIEKDMKDRPGMPALAATYRIRALVAASKLAEAGETFMDSVDILQDGPAVALLNQIVGLAKKEKKLKAADELCQHLMAMEKATSALLAGVAQNSLAVAREMNDPALASERMQQAVKRVNRPRMQLDIVRQATYFIMDKGTKDAAKALRDVAEQVTARAETDSDKLEGHSLLLDIYFVTEDFERALKIVEGDKADTEKDMKDMLLIKIRAHKAMVAGDKLTAVTLFTQFMDIIKNMDEARVSARDPMTDLQVSKNEVLGLNAARIGRLWDELGDKDKARASVLEAKVCYRKALAASVEGSPERKAIEEVLMNMVK